MAGSRQGERRKRPEGESGSLKDSLWSGHEDLREKRVPGHRKTAHDSETSSQHYNPRATGNATLSVAAVTLTDQPVIPSPPCPLSSHRPLLPVILSEAKDLLWSLRWVSSSSRQALSVRRICSRTFRCSRRRSLFAGLLGMTGAGASFRGPCFAVSVPGTRVSG